MIEQDDSVILASNMIKEYAFNENDSLNILRVMDTHAFKEIVCKVSSTIVSSELRKSERLWACGPLPVLGFHLKRLSAQSGRKCKHRKALSVSPFKLGEWTLKLLSRDMELSLVTNNRMGITCFKNCL